MLGFSRGPYEIIIVVSIQYHSFIPLSKLLERWCCTYCTMQKKTLPIVRQDHRTVGKLFLNIVFTIQLYKYINTEPSTSSSSALWNVWLQKVSNEPPKPYLRTVPISEEVKLSGFSGFSCESRAGQIRSRRRVERCLVTNWIRAHLRQNLGNSLFLLYLIPAYIVSTRALQFLGSAFLGLLWGP